MARARDISSDTFIGRSFRGRNQVQNGAPFGTPHAMSPLDSDRRPNSGSSSRRAGFLQVPRIQHPRPASRSHASRLVNATFPAKPTQPGGLSHSSRTPRKVRTRRAAPAHGPHNRHLGAAAPVGKRIPPACFARRGDSLGNSTRAAGRTIGRTATGAPMRTRRTPGGTITFDTRFGARPVRALPPIDRADGPVCQDRRSGGGPSSANVEWTQGETS